MKPENILLTLDQDGQLEPKLADFGLARLSGPPESHRGFVGSVAYSAPEIFLGEACTEASDVWSLGVLLYVMLTGNFIDFNLTLSPCQSLKLCG